MVDEHNVYKCGLYRINRCSKTFSPLNWFFKLYKTLRQIERVELHRISSTSLKIIIYDKQNIKLDILRTWTMTASLRWPFCIFVLHPLHIDRPLFAYSAEYGNWPAISITMMINIKLVKNKKSITPNDDVAHAWMSSDYNENARIHHDANVSILLYYFFLYIYNRGDRQILPRVPNAVPYVK